MTIDNYYSKIKIVNINKMPGLFVNLFKIFYLGYRNTVINRESFNINFLQKVKIIMIFFL